MLVLTKGTLLESMIVTLYEKVTLALPYYIFVFTNVTTKETVQLVFNDENESSPYPERYNEFTVATNATFGTKPVGQWSYDVYESEDGIYEAGLNLLETGKMLLKPAAEITITGHMPTTTYTGYAG